MPPSVPFTRSDHDRDALLPALRDRAQWVCWRAERRDGAPTKVPIDPTTCAYASVTAPETWADHDLARAVADTRADVDGVGFVFTADDSLVGIDLDDCLTLAIPGPGVRPTDRARSVVDRVDSYTEFSPSRTGLHVLARGDLPVDGAAADGLELYTRRRFFTVTGDHVAATPTGVRDRAAAVRAIYDTYVDAAPRPSLDPETDLPGGVDVDSGAAATSPDGAATADAACEPDSRAGSDSDAAPDAQPELDLDAVLERARNAANGDRFERLWNGSTAGYPSHSEADMALCTLLAFWTGGDPAAIDALFRRSGLMRPKWDADRGAVTYGERTIAKALAYVDDYYDPPTTE